MAETFTKGPDEILDYTFNWTDYLATGETIAGFVIAADTGITSGTESQASGVVTYWLTGGTACTTYKVACKIVTSVGRTAERTVTVWVIDR